MKILTTLSALFFLILLSLSSVCSKELKLELTEDTLTLQSEAEPLTDILKKFSEQGIRVRIDPQINPDISASLYNSALGPALRSILKSVDYVLVWQDDVQTSSKQPRLKEIRVFRRGHEERVQDLRSLSNLEVVKNGDGTYHVKDILLLQLQPGISKAALESLLNQIGGTILDAHYPLGLLKLRLPEGVDIADVARTVAQNPGVISAEPDFAYPVKGNKEIIGGDLSSSSSKAEQAPIDSALIAVVDSGLQDNYDESPFVAGAFDAISQDSYQSDTLGHGTQMTLLAAGAISPEGTSTTEGETGSVLAIRGIDDNGYTSNYSLIKGIDYAIEMEAEVMSLSWGSATPSSMLKSATEYALSNGIVLVAAAGNEPTGEPVYPAAYEDVIGVGALTESGEPWLQSNFGDFVDIQAPGMAEMPVGYKGDPGMYVGTSIATAYTARLIAEILQVNPDADLETVLNELKSKSEIQ